MFLLSWGSLVGVVGSIFLVWVSKEMGKQFEDLSAKGEKVGEPSKVLVEKLAALQAEEEDTSCGFAEEGQDAAETPDPSKATESKGAALA